ncbi:MAG: radical SAM protein [Nitrospirota bacterium]
MNKRVLFIFPPPDKLKETRFGAPLGILYLSSELISAGYEVKLADFNVEKYDLDKIRNLLEGKDIVGISIPSYSLNNGCKIIRDIREISSDIPIVAGGPDCILFPRLVEGTDVTVINEAEDTIVAIFDSILKRRDLSKCQGVIFKDQVTGEVKYGVSPVLKNNLNHIKFPARHLINNYAACGGTQIKSPNLPKSTLMLTSRGCPFHCRFCARDALSYSNYRERSVDNVLEEIEEIYRAGYKVLWISDDNFTVNTDRAYKIMEGIISLNLKIVLAFSSWVGAANEDLFLKFKEAGGRIISFGLESGNQDVLDFYRKPITLDKIRYAVELADKCGLFTAGNFIFGSPMETKEHLRKTLEFAERLPLDTVNFKVLGYMAGSNLWAEAVKDGKILEDERNVFADKKRGLGNFDIEELLEFTKSAYKEFCHDKRRQERLKNKIKRLGLPYPILMRQ